MFTLCWSIETGFGKAGGTWLAYVFGSEGSDAHPSRNHSREDLKSAEWTCWGCSFWLFVLVFVIVLLCLGFHSSAIYFVSLFLLSFVINLLIVSCFSCFLLFCRLLVEVASVPKILVEFVRFINDMSIIDFSHVIPLDCIITGRHWLLFGFEGALFLVDLLWTTPN